MEKKCPNCGKELPEEASFCLFCFTDIDNFKKSEVRPVAVAATQKSSAKAVFSGALKGKFNKKLFCRIGIVAAFLLIMGICIFAMKNMNSDNSLKTSEGTTIIKETSTVAVTDESGETVTDEAGEQVFEVVEVTKIEALSTTEKQGFFDKIVDSITKATENNSEKNDKTAANGDSSSLTEKPAKTTEMQGFFDDLFDNIFGDKVKTTISSTESPSTTLKPQETTEEYGTTEASSTSQESTTAKPSTTNPTTTQTTEVYTTEKGSYYFEYEPQYASNPDGNIALTKYVGSASVVTIPSFIDGRKVAAIKENCFLNDKKIREINFDDSSTYTIILHTHCFNSLTSLNRVIFNNKDFFTSTPFAYNCPIVYLGNGEENGNKLIDGAYYLGNSFLWFTAHPSYTILTLPSWCTKIDNAHNLHECPNLQVLNIHKNISNVPKSAIYYGDGLQAINVENGHSEVFSSEGVLFYKRIKTDAIFNSVYPYCKTDKSFKLPDNCYMSLGKGSIYTTNSYLEELWLPEKGYLKSPDSKDFYKNCYPKLKKIYIAQNHPQYDDIKKTFTGELIIKDF